MEASPRKRGRPRIPVTEEVLEARRLAKQRYNARRSGASASRGPSMAITNPPALLPVRRRGGDMSCHTIVAYLSSIRHTSMWNDAIDHSQLSTCPSTLEKAQIKLPWLWSEQTQISVIPNMSSHTPRKIEMDEVKNYLSCRYVSAAEASWRIFGFPIHHREPYVQRLFFHLEDEQEVRFRDDEALPQIIGRFRPDSSMFVQWLLNNRRDETGRDLTYVRYPIRYRWDNAGKFWTARKQKIDVVGRMVYAHPASGERFYMRLLLNHVAGAKYFEDIRTVDGIVYPTYKQACFHRGLLESDKEWHLALDDAANFATAAQLRDLFVTMLLYCEVSNPFELWDKHWAALADDVEYIQRKMLNFPSLVMADCDKKTFALEAINALLNQHGKSVSDYPGLPEINIASTSKFRNQLLLEEMMYDRQALGIEAAKQIGCLNHMQRLIFDKVIQSVTLGTGGFYFVYGHGGTGKTFLWSTIICRLRSEGMIVLAVASSGIASLLIEGGRTTHSRFRIPIDVNEDSTCEIKKNTLSPVLTRI